MVNKFEEIFSKYDTDKVAYSQAYEECFGNIREDIQLLFEIGVNRGGSVRAWKEYFPNALIVGMDKNGHCYFEENRIKIEIGNACHGHFIGQVMAKYGWPDVVIDDGSHRSKAIKKSFDLLYQYTQTHYIIEDLAMQSPDVQGGYFLNGPPTMSVIIQEAEKLLLYRNAWCRSIRVYHSICLFIK